MPQQASPELYQWIAAQARAGVTAQGVLDALKAAGWEEGTAIAAMEEAARRYQHPGTTAQPELPPAAAVPEPDLADSPLYVDAGDRRVAVLGGLAAPRVVIFGSLLSDDECAALIAAARPRLARSQTVVTSTGGTEVNQVRTSRGMFFERGESELVRRIEQRIARLLRWPLENGEGLQVLHYVPGTEYKPHYDYFDPDAAGTPAILRRGGQRVATLVMYLNEPEKGGATAFPDVHFKVAPKRGNAVFFSYERPHPSTHTLHAGMPVIAGEKWIATKWLREREFV
ncbi:MAG: 2-oxoglutarate-dependent dioxygenase [Burkholderiaceae bacterium]|nr:MAG: 2-oxoglutarate-dependent dioxygenase [Burkholderiaceae bacterium]